MRSLNLSASSWNLVEDKSIETAKGTDSRHDPMKCELISPVLQFNKATMEQIEVICNGLQSKMDANTNGSCGFHVHLNAEDLSLADIIRITMNYSYFEPVIDLFMTPERRGNQNPHIRSMRGPVMTNLDRLRSASSGHDSNPCLSASSLSVLDLLNPKPRRNHKLNVTNLFYFNLSRSGFCKQSKYINTIENRHHHATLQYDDVLCWMGFHSMIIRRMLVRIRSPKGDGAKRSLS